MPWLYWADCPLVCQDPKSITCQTYHMLAASLSTESFMSGQETPNRNGATLPAQAACWDFSIAMHCGLFAAKKKKNQTQFACTKSHALLGHRAQALCWIQLSRQPAEAGPAACLAASCGGKGCSSRMLRQGAMADVLGSLP